MVKKPPVIEIIRNEDEFLKEEVQQVRKDFFNLKKQLEEELEKINSTDSLRYNKINYDVFDSIKTLNTNIHTLKNKYKSKSILDEKNRRKIDSKIKSVKEDVTHDYVEKINTLNEEVLNEIQNNYNLLTNTCDLMKATSDKELNQLAEKIDKKTSDLKNAITKAHNELFEDYTTIIENLDETLSNKIIETNQDILNTENVITGYVKKLNENLNKYNEKYEKENRNISTLLNETADSLNVFKDEHNEYAESTLKYIKGIEENYKNYKEDVANNLARKLNSVTFNKYVKELKEKFETQNVTIEDVKENLVKITNNIVDKISLTNETALNSDQINQLIIQLLENKFDQKLNDVLDEQIQTTKTAVKVLSDDIEDVNNKIEEFVKNSVNKTEHIIQKQIDDVTNKVQELNERKSLTKNDFKQFITDNPELFDNQDDNSITDYQYKDGWLFFKKGKNKDWDTPIKVKNDIQQTLPIMGSSGIGGGAVGGSLSKYYITKMWDVNNIGHDTHNSLITWDEETNLFVFNYKVNDDGTENTDLWTADKIINFVEDAVTPEPSEYLGLWNASVNDPTITQGDGELGQYYIVSNAGTWEDTSFDEGDWIWFNGSSWVRTTGGYVPYTGATGDVDLGSYDLITTGLVRGSNFYAYRRASAGGVLFYGIGYSGNDFTVDNNANIITDGGITSVGNILSQGRIQGEELYSLDNVAGNAVNRFSNLDTGTTSGIDLQFYGGKLQQRDTSQIANIMAIKDNIWTAADVNTQDSSIIFSTANNGAVSENVFISNTGAIGIGVNPTDVGKALVIKDSHAFTWLTSDETLNGTGMYYTASTGLGSIWTWNGQAMSWDADGNVTFPNIIDVTGDITTLANINAVNGVFSGDLSANNLSGNNTGDQDSSNLEMANCGTKTLQNWYDTTQSAGWCSGFEFTDNGDGSLTVSSGTVILKSTNSDIGENYCFDISEVTFSNVEIADKTEYYVYIDYNAGTPEIALSETSETKVSNGTTKINLGLIFREGTEIYCFRAGHTISNISKKIQSRFNSDGNITLKSGGKVGETGTRNLTVTSAVLWGGLTRFTTDAIDTSGTDTFEYYKLDGLGGYDYYNETATQINNTVYDNGSGTPIALTNRYRTDWVYLSNDGELLIILGTNNDSNLANAQNQDPPTNIPKHCDFATLVAEIIVQGGGDIIEIDNIITSSDFNRSGIINHNETTNIQGGTADEYYHLTNSEYSNKVSNVGASTDNAIVRFDGATGKIVQDSLVTISDTGSVNIPDSLYVNGGKIVTNSGSDTNTVFGVTAGVSITSGVSNVMFGYDAGGDLSTATGNVIVGSYAGQRCNGYSNTFVGNQAGEQTLNGYYNVYLGFQSGYLGTTANTNTFLGHESGRANTTGSGNVYLGYQAGKTAPVDQSNKLIIANSETQNLITGDFTTKSVEIYGDLYTSGDTMTFGGNIIELVLTTVSEGSIGIGSSTTDVWQTIIGASNTASDRSVSIGVLNNSTHNYCVNIGYDADSGGTKAVSIGYATDATAESNIAIGDTAQATGTDNAIAIGTCTASGNKSICMGETSQATQTSSVAIGYGADAIGGYGCVAIGVNATANGGGGFAMGYLSTAAAYGIGLGQGSNSSQTYASALGYRSIASGINSISLGTGTMTTDGPTASGRSAIAIGSYNAATTDAAPVASGQNSIALGAGTTSSAENAVAIGTGCSNAVANEAKIGGDVTSAFLDTAIRRNLRTITTSDTADATDSVVLLDGSSSAVTYTLPTATSGREITIKCIDNTNTIKISSTANIDGSASDITMIQYDSVKVIADGTNWWII